MHAVVCHAAWVRSAAPAQESLLVLACLDVVMNAIFWPILRHLPLLSVAVWLQ
jgi:hypothetical protein